MRRNKIKAKPQTAYQKAEKALLGQFCKHLRCAQRNFPGLPELLGSGTWVVHFDALTHNQTEASLNKLLQMLYATKHLKADLYRHIEKKILSDLEENEQDRQEADAWY